MSSPYTPDKTLWASTSAPQKKNMMIRQRSCFNHVFERVVLIRLRYVIYRPKTPQTDIAIAEILNPKLTLCDNLPKSPTPILPIRVGIIY